MTLERWNALWENDDLQLSSEELAEGWHWCLDFDGLLVGPGMGEVEFCNCGVSALDKERLRLSNLRASGKHPDQQHTDNEYYF